MKQFRQQGLGAVLAVSGALVACSHSDSSGEQARTKVSQQKLSVSLPFSFPRGLSLVATPLYGASSLDAGAQVAIEAPRGQIVSGGPVSVANKGAVGDPGLGNELSVVSGASISFGPHVRVTGSATASGPITFGSDDLVSEGVFSPTAYPTNRSFTISADFAAARAGLVITNNQQLDLSPGESIAFVEVKAGAILRLSSGRYYFGDFKLASNSTLEVDDSSGEVFIFTSGDLQLDGTTTFRRGPSHLAIVHSGVSPSIGPSYRGTIIAPAAEISLTGPHSVFEGGFYGRDIEIGPNVRTRFASFSGWGPLLCGEAAGPSLAEARKLPPTCTNPSACCAPRLSRKVLTDGVDQFDVEAENTCLSAGGGNDIITGCRMGGSYVLAGDGNDDLQLGEGVIAYGGAGDDRIESFGNATLFGNDGDDQLLAQAGNNIVFPGPGNDIVQTGDGDDTVIFRDACEAVGTKKIDLGGGRDIVLSPLTRLEMESRGITFIGVEEFRLEGDSCRSECRAVPKCAAGGRCITKEDQTLACRCPPWASGPTCETAVVPDLPEVPPPPLDGTNDATRDEQAKQFLAWYVSANVGQSDAARRALDTTRSNLPMREAFARQGRNLMRAPLADTKMAATEVLGYVKCRACIEVLIDNFPTTAPEFTSFSGSRNVLHESRAAQTLIAVALASSGTRRAKEFLLQRASDHTDPEVRRAIIFSLAQSYGESIRPVVVASVRPEDLPAFDWVANSDPNFDTKLRALFRH